MDADLTGRRAFLLGAGALATGAVASGVAAGEASAARRNVEQPQVPSRGMHRVLWSVETARSAVALTFDDGPDPRVTPALLEVLREHGAVATFFFMGRNVEAHPDLARAVVAAGHEVGNHTWGHVDQQRASGTSIGDDVTRGSAVIEEATGVRPSWYRPPQGQLTGWGIRAAAVLGQDTALWSRSRGRGTSVEPVTDHLAGAGPGEVVLLHDGFGRGTFIGGRTLDRLIQRRRVELAALPYVLDRLRSAGFGFETLSGLAR